MSSPLQSFMKALIAALTGRSRRKKRAIAHLQTLHGRTGIALSRLCPKGAVLIDGEVWQASAEQAIEEGTGVIVIGTNGVLLNVKIG